MIYKSVYPLVYSTTYVKTTTYNNTGNYEGYRTTDPSNSLVGGWENKEWLSQATLSNTNQRFHIDLGSAIIIVRIYYENCHYAGASTTQGSKNFTFWGSNDASAFAELTYGTDTNWTQLTTGASSLDQHTGSDVADPKYILVTNTTAYRYYAFKFADNWGGTDYMGVRRIELQKTAVLGLMAFFE